MHTLPGGYEGGKMGRVVNFASLLVNRHSPFGPTPRREPTETDDGTSQLQLDADWVILSVCNMATPRCWLGPTRVKRTSFRPAYWVPFGVARTRKLATNVCFRPTDRKDRIEDVFDCSGSRTVFDAQCAEGPLWVNS